MSDSNQGAGGIKWLCLLVPLLGLVLYLVWQQEKPQAAKRHILIDICMSQFFGAC